jgi:hypothetical protein
MTNVTVEKPKATRTGVYQVRTSGKVGIMAAEQEHQVFLYLLGENPSLGHWFMRNAIEELPPGSRLLAIL